MGKQKLTPEQLREQEEMRLFIQNNRDFLDKNSKKSSTDFIGNVVSSRDIINAENSLEEFEAEEKELQDKKDRQAKIYEGMAKGFGELVEAQKPEETPEELPLGSFSKDDLAAQIKKQNEQVEINNMSELEKMYYTELEPETFANKKLIEKQMADIRNRGDIYETIEYQVKTMDGGFEPRTKRVMKQSVKAELAQLQEKYDELTRPANQKFGELVESKLQMVKDVQDSDETSYFSHKYEEAHLSEVFYEKARDIINANVNKSGFWKAVADGVTDEDFYTLGAASLDANIRLVGIADKIENDEELDEGEKMLLDAYVTYNEAQSQIKTGDMYSVGSGTTASIPWMVQFAATRGIGGTAEKGVEMALMKGAKKYLNKNIKRKVSTSLLANMSKTTGTGVGIYTQAALMPQTYSDIADRYHGQVQVTRDSNGRIDNYYMRDKLHERVKSQKQETINKIKEDARSYDDNGNIKENVAKKIAQLNKEIEQSKPESALSATYKGMTNSAIEALTERVGGEFFLKRLKKLGVEMPSILPDGKFSNKFGEFKEAIGWNGIAPEYLEEVMNIPLNAFFVGDSKYSDLWDGQQQLHTLMQVAITGGGMSIGNQAINLPSRIKNDEYYQERKKMVNKFREMAKANPSELDNIINLGSSSNDLISLKEKERELRADGKTKEADQLGEQILYNQVLKAFDTGTIEEFEKALDQVAVNPETPEGTKLSIAKAKGDIEILKRTHEKFKGLKNHGNIMRLQTNKLLARKAEQELERQLSDLEEDVIADVEAYAQRNNIKTPDNISPSRMFTEEFEDKAENDAHQKFLNDIRNAGLLSVNQYETLQTTKDAIAQINKEQRLLFNEQISPAYQKAMEDEFTLKGKLNQNSAFNKAIENNDEQTYENEFKKIANKYKGTLSDKRVTEIKEELDQFIAVKKLQQEVEKQQVINQKVSEVKAEENNPQPAEPKVEAENAEPKVEVPEVEGEVMEDTETDEINNALNQQFAQEAASFKNVMQPQTKGEAIVVPDVNAEGFWDLPREAVPNMPQAQKDNIKNRVAAMYGVLKNQTGKNPSFNDLVNKFIDSTSKEQADEFYNILALGWDFNEYAKTDYKKEYDKIFDPFKDLAQEFVSDTSVFGPETKTEMEIANEQIIEKADKEEAPIVGFDETNVPIKKTAGYKTVTPDLKLGFLSMKYVDQVNEQGVVERKTVSSSLNSDGVIDFKELLDPDKYQAGSKLFVGVPSDEVLSNIYMSERNEKGEQTSQTYNDWIAKKLKDNPNFKETDEYISRVPVLAYSTEGKPVAYIHDINWYNPYNIGFSDNLPLQAEVIEKGRAEVLELRKQIINNGMNTIKVSQKTGSVFHTIDPSLPTISINEANPQSTIAVAKNRGQLYVGEDAFENKNKVLLNKDDIVKGHSYDIRRIGVDKDGRQTYRAFEVLRGDESNEYKLDNETFNTVKWALASFLKANNFNSYFKKKNIEISEEQAKDIADRVFSETGYDISQRDDLYNFLKQYILFEDLDYKMLTDKLFSDNPDIAKDFKQHTSNNALGTNPNMIVIDETGKVNPTGKKYQDYLKDTLRTNVKSFNVGTEENPVYATAIQPKIKFEYEKGAKEEAPTVKEIVDQAIEEVVEEVTEDTSPEALFNKANSLLSNLGFNPSENFDDLPTQIEDTSLIEKIFNTTEGLSVIQEYQLIDFMFNNISKSIDINYGANINKENLLKEIQGYYNKIVAPSQAEVSKILNQISGLYEANPQKYEKMGKLIQDYNKVMEVYDSINKNWKKIEDKALEKLYKYTGIKEVGAVEDVSLREKNYSKTSLEESTKDRTSYRLRRFFAGIEQKTPNGETKKGFLNLPTYVGFNDVYNKIAQILSSPNEIESDFDLMIAKLEQSKDSVAWLPEVISKLKEADLQIQKEFVYNYTKHTLSMKFAMYSTDGKGSYNLKVYDTNAHEITRQIRETWKNNFIVSPLVNSSQDFYSINKVKAQNLLDEFNSWGTEQHNVNRDTVKNWLANFGIVLSKDAFNELADKGIYYRGENIEYKDMFDSNDTVFGLLHRYLDRIVKEENTEFEENENNHPFSDMAGVLQVLSSLESKYTNQSITLSFRDNGKSIFGLTPNKFATDRILKLKQYSDGVNEFVDDLQSLSFNKQSAVLELLQIEEDFRTKLAIDHVGITALKQHGKKASPFSGVTDLNTIDHDVAKMTGFQDTKQGNIKATVDKDGKIQKGGNGLSMRMGRMFLPTMSDKSQMLMLNTGVFNLLKDKRKAFQLDTEGNVNFTETLSNLMFNQIVKPELDRIVNFHTNVNNTNIKDYDLAAQIFNFIPELNNIKDENGIRLIELIANNPTVFNSEYIHDNFKTEIDSVVKQVIDEKVNDKLDIWESNLERNEKTDQIKTIKFFDSTYLSEATGTLDEKYKLGMYDFVINSFISNANMFAVLAGDPAMYSQNKLFKNFGVDNIAISQMAALYGKEKSFKLYNTHSSFLKDLNKLKSEGVISDKLYSEMKSKIKPLAYSATDEAFANLSEKVGVNIGKRLALLIAPGNKIADSKKGKYMQVFLEDAIHISENTEYLVELYHGKEAANSIKPLVEKYRNTDNEATRADIRNTLSDKFPDLAEYFDIESTDAQEYTTLDEHLIVLEGQGRISKEQSEKIGNKLLSGEDLSKEELGIVLQPIKPVHTGQIIDKEQDVLRTVYVKSSSFPLIPQLTKGRKIDALRLKLEELQEKNNMPVRASYQTANKVGAMNNAINPFTEDGLAKAGEASLILDRDNFRIQQDVPFKSDLKKEDKVSMGTQIFKLLFGDGMLDQKGFVINGEEMNGKELYDKFNKDFAKLIGLKKKSLYRELGLDEMGQPTNQKESMQKLQDLLQREAIDRGYPRQDVEGLSFVEKKDINGNTYYDFKLPLWISSNSNRYEALLNAIVTNRIISQKLPGNSFVAGSEEGMDVKENMEGIDGTRVIHVGDYKGGELKGVQNIDGTFKEAEVLIPSKFKGRDGKLIDLYQKKNGVYKYLKVGENNELILNEDMVDTELLTNFSFRTPTSSHVSASVIKIAGILPPESGDLMVVPKNFTKQKGLDYDVDKETAYQLWTNVDANGKIETLNQSHIDEMVRRLTKARDIEKAADEFLSLFEEDFGPTGTVQEKIDKIKDKFEQKLLENEFIKTHIAVFKNPNKEVQKKINKVLSMDFAKSQAEMIEELNKAGADNTNFSILSDEYQKSKMALGAAGKLAIGVYSNYVTFHGLTQQTERPLLLTEDLGDGPQAKVFKIGNFVSEGDIGKQSTLDGERTIAEVFAEKQNTATDNEKEQILGRVNVNALTINVDSLLTLLGFDKGDKVEGKDTSIPYLFLSQPIIKDYVEMMQSSQAITADFNFDREAIIMKQLTEKYGAEFEMTDEVSEQLLSQLTSENMINAITSKGENIPGLQMAVLQQFFELDKYAKNIGSLQSVLNTNSLGKSIAESNDKYDKLSKVHNNPLVENATELIGDYVKANDYNGEEGYMRVGDVFIKPKTPQGQIVVNGIKTGNDLWNEHFPYSDTNINIVMNEIMEITNAEEKSDRRKIEMKFDIFKEIKKYINSHNKNGIFNEKASVERQRLFIDSADNQSLANYLNAIKNVDIKNVERDNKPGVYNLKRNKLFSKFEFNLNTNGEPSLVKFNNTTSENFDEDYLYTAVAEMIINNEALPNKNGEAYNTRKLAADMVAYAYLEGGVQEAIQFVKYVPIEYLETVGFTDILQNYSPKRDGNIFSKILGVKVINENNPHETHKFVKQYIQHNPQMATQFDPKEEVKLFGKKKFNGKKLESFTLLSEESPKFVSRKERTKSKRKQDKFSLYQNVGNNVFQRISVLGVHGMNEYELGNDNAKSLLDSVEVEDIKMQPKVVSNNKNKQVNDRFNIKGGNATEILSHISNFKGKKYKHFGKLADFLSEFVKGDLKVVVGSTVEDNGVLASGRTKYNQDGSITIMIDSQLMASNDHEQIARTFVHEFIHSVTAKELMKYFDKKTGQQKTKDLPLHVSRVLRVFNETKRQLGPELQALIEKRRRHQQGDLPSTTTYSAEDLEITYGATSIFEFVTTALTEPEFQKRMNEVQFKKSGETLWDRFKKVVVNLLFANSINVKNDSVTFEALSSTLDFITKENPTKSNKNSTFETAKQSNVDDNYLKMIEQEMMERGEITEDNRTNDINRALGLDLPLETVNSLPDLC